MPVVGDDVGADVGPPVVPHIESEPNGPPVGPSVPSPGPPPDAEPVEIDEEGSRSASGAIQSIVHRSLFAIDVSIVC